MTRPRTPVAAPLRAAAGCLAAIVIVAMWLACWAALLVAAVLLIKWAVTL